LDRGELDTAQDWYRKSPAIEEEFGNRPGIAMTYGQCGLLAEQQGQRAEALAWAVRCVSLFDEIPHPSTGSGPRQLVADMHDPAGNHFGVFTPPPA
jgi:hypothetical protein